MTRTSVIDEISRVAVVPVVVIDDAAHAGDLARTLRDNGIATAEVTLRTPAALDAISAMASVEGFLVGAGTVVSAADVDAAIDAGAQYLVSPGLDEPCVHRAARARHPVRPRCGHRDRGPARASGGAQPRETLPRRRTRRPSAH